MTAHQDGSAPHDLWLRWNGDPVLVVAILVAAWAYQRGASRRGRPDTARRSRCFVGGLVAVAVALLSPLDALSGELASAHMVQHVVLVLVAAPLLALGAPVATMLSGTSLRFRRVMASTRRRIPAATIEVLRGPIVAWLLHTGTLWFWHASTPYDAAVDQPVVHAVEHASFLLTGALFWSSVLPARHRSGTSYGHGALLVFTMALHSVFLAALLTFATTPWYDAYGATTSAWGLEPLADQHLAGVIMWVPAGLIHVLVGVLLVAAWIRDSERRTGDGTVDDWSLGTAPPPIIRHPRRSPSP